MQTPKLFNLLSENQQIFRFEKLEIAKFGHFCLNFQIFDNQFCLGQLINQSTNSFSCRWILYLCLLSLHSDGERRNNVGRSCKVCGRTVSVKYLFGELSNEKWDRFVLFLFVFYSWTWRALFVEKCLKIVWCIWSLCVAVTEKQECTWLMFGKRRDACVEIQCFKAYSKGRSNF